MVGPRSLGRWEKAVERILLLWRLALDCAFRRRLASGLVATGFVASIGGLVAPDALRTAAGLIYWLALLFIWPDINKRTRAQALWLLALAFPGVIAGFHLGVENHGPRLVEANTEILSMLVAIGFIAAVPQRNEVRPAPAGLKGLAGTYLGVHLIGAVINYSAVVIFGDRMANGKGLSRDQAVVLGRAFAAAGFWSPFFATMAVAVSVSPGHDLWRLVQLGLLLSFASIVLTVGELALAGKHRDFFGLRLDASCLRLPLFLTVSVVGAHKALPDLSILQVVTLVCPLVAIAAVLFSQTPAREYIVRVRHRLPERGGELALFLPAGALGGSLATLWNIFPYVHPLSGFGPFEAALAFGAIVMLSLVGVHPVVAASLLGSVVDINSTDPTLLAFVIVAAWAVSSGLSPLSGQNIGIQGRYEIPTAHITAANLYYSLLIAIVFVVAVYVVF